MLTRHAKLGQFEVVEDDVVAGTKHGKQALGSSGKNLFL
jgi:hypothetical protein